LKKSDLVLFAEACNRCCVARVNGEKSAPCPAAAAEDDDDPLSLRLAGLEGVLTWALEEEVAG